MKDNVECAGEEFSSSLNRLKGARVDELANFRDLEIAMLTLLQHEANRIEAKLGREHPRVQQLNARLKSNLKLVAMLETERERTEIEVPEVAEDATLVHGRVVDEDGWGITGLVVCLVDERAKPIKDIKDSPTARNGYFSLSIDPELTERIVKEHKNGIFLAIFTNRNRLVYRERKPLSLAKGARLLREKSLSRSKLIARQPANPEPGPDTVRVPDVIGKPEADAARILRAAKLTVGGRKTELAPDRVGLVVFQEPKADTEIPVGSVVSLLIGVAEPVKAPKMVGLKGRSARRKIKQNGLIVGTITERESEAVGVVLEQNPEAGKEVPMGSAINLVVGRQGAEG